MKLLSPLLIIVAAFHLSSAQTPVNQAGPKELIVIHHEWLKTHRDLVWHGFPTQSKDETNLPTPQVPRIITEYLYKITVKNISAKAITQVNWDYIFTDPTTGKEVDRHHFQSRMKIPAHYKLTLSAFSASPPTKTVTVGALSSKDRERPFTEQVAITCVRYKDGTFWQAPSVNKANCILGAQARP